MNSSIIVHFYLRGMCHLFQTMQQAFVEFPTVKGFADAVKQWEVMHPEAEAVMLSGLHDGLLPALPSGVHDPRSTSRKPSKKAA